MAPGTAATGAGGSVLRARFCVLGEAAREPDPRVPPVSDRRQHMRRLVFDVLDFVRNARDAVGRPLLKFRRVADQARELIVSGKAAEIQHEERNRSHKEGRDRRGRRARTSNPTNGSRISAMITAVIAVIKNTRPR